MIYPNNYSTLPKVHLRQYYITVVQGNKINVSFISEGISKTVDNLVKPLYIYLPFCFTIVYDKKIIQSEHQYIRFLYFKMQIDYFWS